VPVLWGGKTKSTSRSDIEFNILNLQKVQLEPSPLPHFENTPT
jgi:hypothetical protein